MPNNLTDQIDWEALDENWAARYEDDRVNFANKKVVTS